jgi:hypothetical protein
MESKALLHLHLIQFDIFGTMIMVLTMINGIDKEKSPMVTILIISIMI